MTIADANPILDYLKEFRASVDQRFEQIDQRFERIDQRFDLIDGRLGHIDGRLDGLCQAHTALESRVTDVQYAIASLAVSTNTRFNTVEKRFDMLTRHFDRKIDAVRTELVDHMERLHTEVSGRVDDMVGPARGSSGGAAVTN